MLRKVCKKSSLGTPSKNISVFAGFTSRWMMALECKYDKPVHRQGCAAMESCRITHKSRAKPHVRSKKDEHRPQINVRLCHRAARDRIRKTLCKIRLREKRAKGTSGHLNSHLARHRTRDRPLAKVQVPLQGDVGGLHAYDPSCRCECNLHP